MLSQKVTVKQSGNYSVLPADKYQVLVVDVEDIMQNNPFKGKEELMLNYKFAILDEKEDADGATTRGRFVWKRMSPSFNEKSWLFKMANGVYGHTLSQEEKDSFDVEKSVLGKQVCIMVEEKPSAKDSSMIFNNIISFSPIKKEMEPVEYTAKPSEVIKESAPLSAPKVATEDELKELGL